MPILAACLRPVSSASPWVAPRTGPDWLHEVKYDGYRLRLERDGDRVRHQEGGMNEFAMEVAV